MTKRMARRTVVIATAASLMIAGGASAQESAGATQGPLVLSPITTAIVFSPDVKVTTVDGQTSTLVGGYAGKLIEGRALVGGAIYWLADPRDETRLTYGGLLLGWRVYGTDRFNTSVRSLLGVGEATVIATFSPGQFVGQRSGREIRLGFRENFLVAEPQVSVQLGLTRIVHVNFGAGYRITSGADEFDETLRGVTGSIGVQFDIGR